MNSLVLASLLSVTAGGGFSHAEFAEAQNNVQREFRFYRIQVYYTYRTWRPEFDRRRRVGDDMYQAWKNAGGEPHQATPLVQWYRDAKQASLPNVNLPLPPAPVFPLALHEAANAEELARQSPQLPPGKTSSRRRYQIKNVTTPNQLAGPELHKPRPTAQRRTPAKPTWQSVSKALLKGVGYGVSRTAP